MKTTEKLAIALRDVGAPPEMITHAERGYYDDFQSELPSPIVQLVNDCRKNGLDDIANGDFDATQEESEAWFQREGKDLLK